MRIGFDAKRAFFNTSGLGNYSRNLIASLIKYHPENEYYLYTPAGFQSTLFAPRGPVEIRYPEKRIDRMFSAGWRSWRIEKQLTSDKIDLFHGLSAELPFSWNNVNIPSVVTIHDLIFLRYPRLYSLIDRKIYTQKARNACRKTSRIVAISNQTREDIVNFLDIDPEKIEVVYQSCHPSFFVQADQNRQKAVRDKYDLPGSFILSVGTIEERKNLLGVVRALEIAKPGIPLVVAGRPRKYARKVKNYIATHDAGEVIFLEGLDFHDLPAIYQMASLFVYPSFFEGFGIPIIEALASGVPVMTSKDGCFAEAGGPGTRYVDPHRPENIAAAIKEILSDESLQNSMIQTGKKYVRQFSPEATAHNMFTVYENTLSTVRS